MQSLLSLQHTPASCGGKDKINRNFEVIHKSLGRIWAKIRCWFGSSLIVLQFLSRREAQSLFVMVGIGVTACLSALQLRRREHRIRDVILAPARGTDATLLCIYHACYFLSFSIKCSLIIVLHCPALSSLICCNWLVLSNLTSRLVRHWSVLLLPSLRWPELLFLRSQTVYSLLDGQWSLLDCNSLASKFHSHKQGRGPLIVYYQLRSFKSRSADHRIPDPAYTIPTFWSTPPWS